MKPDSVSALLAAAEALRTAARSIETLDLMHADSREDLRSLLAGIRREAFCCVSLAAVELRPAAVARVKAARS